ncbi:MAG: diacylglycerol kinase family protein, partial [Clostridia bacterium]|nr:diacylglycerol kinase family protein [Clostridia bacterium]
VYTIRTEGNMRVHLCFAFYVVLAGFVTKISTGEWTAVLICIGAVTALECLNTAVERLCDELCPQKSEGIKHVKDAAAGAVFCVAAASALTGGTIFFRTDKFSATWEFAKAYPAAAVLIVLTLIPLSIFAKGRKK